MSKKIVYYAHFMGIYNTLREERDINTLEALGFDVINPNSKHTSTKFAEALKKYDYLTAFNKVFGDLVREADVFAFRGLPNGKISSGVYLELEYAQDTGKPIIELPSNVVARKMSVEETKEALREFGVK